MAPPTGGQSGRQRTSLALKVPARLHVRVESGTSTLRIAGVAAVELVNLRGEASLKEIAGPATISHRGGSVAIENAGSVKLTGRGGEVTISGVGGDLSIAMEQGGRVRASAVGGAIDVDVRNAEVAMENLSATRGPIRVNATAGSVTLEGVGVDTRVEGRNSRIAIGVARAAPVAIYSEGADVSLTPPPDGYRLDAVAMDGRIGSGSALAALGLELSRSDEDRQYRASGAVNGGGPTVTVRTTRGDLTIASDAR